MKRKDSKDSSAALVMAPALSRSRSGQRAAGAAPDLLGRAAEEETNSARGCRITNAEERRGEDSCPALLGVCHRLLAAIATVMLLRRVSTRREQECLPAAASMLQFQCFS